MSGNRLWYIYKWRLLLTSVPRVGAKKRSTNNSRGFNVSLSSGTSANVCPSLTFALRWLNNDLPWTRGSGNSTFLKSKLPLTSFYENKKSRLENKNSFQVLVIASVRNTKKLTTFISQHETCFVIFFFFLKNMNARCSPACPPPDLLLPLPGHLGVC